MDEVYKITSLEILNAQTNKIRYINGLEQLSNLVTLNLNHNLLKSIK